MKKPRGVKVRRSEVNWDIKIMNVGLCTVWVIVQTRVSVLPLISKYREAGWKYEAQPSFILTSLSVFRIQRNTFECVNFLLKLIDILRENRDCHLGEFGYNLPPIFKYLLNINFFWIFDAV